MKAKSFRQQTVSQTLKLSFLAMLVFAFSSFVSAQKKSSGVNSFTRTITVITEPQSDVRLNGILRGKTDESGKLQIKNIPAGLNKLNVRARGFKEITQSLTAAQKGEIKVSLSPTNDEAEISFQSAEAEKDKQRAVELYRKAISLRPAYAGAYIGLARTLSEIGESEAALKTIADWRKTRPADAEASAVEGRIYNADGEEAKAIASYKRAIREGRGFQPEAHTGLGLIYRDKAEESAGRGDFEGEKAHLTLAANELSVAVKQLSGAPDAEIILQLLGGVYEKMRDYKKAIAAYQEFLRLFPESREKTAVESFIEQLKIQMRESQR